MTNKKSLNKKEIDTDKTKDRMPRGFAPVRLDKVEEAKKILKIIDQENREKTRYKRPTINQKLIDLFIDRTSIEDGFSIRELVLILKPDIATPEQMMATHESDPKTYSKIVLPLITTLKRELNRFRHWEGNKGIHLYSRQTPTGKWLFYNLQEPEEFTDIEKRFASIYLGIQKNMDHTQDVLEMRGAN